MSKQKTLFLNFFITLSYQVYFKNSDVNSSRMPFINYPLFFREHL